MILTLIFCAVVGFVIFIGVVDSFAEPKKKKKKCVKCKENKRLPGSSLCAYCEKIEFNRYRNSMKANDFEE